MNVQDMPGHLIRRLHQLSTQVFTQHMQAQGFDMTSVQFAALDTVIRQPGIDQAGIAAAIAYDRATIGGVIDRLETKGYVTRTVSETDRRAREVRPTPKGTAAFDKVLPVVTDLQDEILQGLEAAEREMLLRLARRVIDRSNV